MLQIVVMNESTVYADADVQAMLPAFTQQVNQDLAGFWNVEQSQFTFVPAGTPPAGAWWVVFLDDSDQACALAYHDLTSEGLPLSKVFVKTLQADNASISVGATHEICEMSVDPWINSAYQDSSNTFWAGEVADPVEDDQYGYMIGNILVTDFVTPSWFAYKNAPGPYDFKGHATAAFQVPAAGYAQKWDPQQGWVQVNGTEAAKSTAMHVKQIARGSRRDKRMRQGSRDKGTQWLKSSPDFSDRKKHGA
jgi:hypothetical protein